MSALDEMWKKLREPFDPKVVRTKPGPGGRPLHFISHGMVTERLIEVDPECSWTTVKEHIYLDGNGAPHCAGVTIAMTVGGVTRVEAGGPQRQDGFANEIKNAYSDAVKRAAMRFGVALGMWESLVDAEYDEDSVDQQTGDIVYPKNLNPTQPAPAAPAPANGQRRPAAWPGLITASQLKYLHGLAAEANEDRSVSVHDFLRGQVYARFKREHTNQMTKGEASQLIGLLDKKDLVDAEYPPTLSDPVEAAQRGFDGMPEEPAHLANIPEPWVN